MGLKCYYSPDDVTWTEITGVLLNPTIEARLDAPSICTIKLRMDHDTGTPFVDWEARNFEHIRVDDESSNIIFRGFLTKKSTSAHEITLFCRGLAARLEWTPFNQNYILQEGKISEVPYTNGAGIIDIIRPDTDANINWAGESAGGDHHELVDTGTSPDINTDSWIRAESLDDSDPEEMGMETLTVTSVQEIKIYVLGLDDATSDDMTVDISNDAWVSNEGAVELNFGVVAANWRVATFSVLGWNQAELTAMQIRLTAPTNVAAGKYFYVYSVYAQVNYTGTSTSCLGVTDEDDAVFTDTPNTDYWVNDQDVGILIVDSSDTIDGTAPVWDCTAIVTTNGTNDYGDATSLDAKNDDNFYRSYDVATADMDIEATIGGTAVDDTKTLHSIIITNKYGTKHTSTNHCKVKLEVKKDAAWIPLDTIYYSAGRTNYIWRDKVYTIQDTDAELQKYLDKTGADYTSMKGVRLKCYGDSGDPTTYVRWDLCTIEIKYWAHDIVPVMKEITTSYGDGTDSLLGNSSTTWTETGVDVGDYFKIGQNTTQILNDACAEAGVGVNVQSTLSKYVARHYKGELCMDVLKSICLLEGLFWWEDFTNNIIIVSSKDDFVDSTVDLTSTDYDKDWEYEDDCNNFYRVEVYGNAAYGLFGYAEDDSVDSIKIKSIVDETITTMGDLQEVANTQLVIWKVKTPSIKLTLNGIQANLTVGKTVGLTMERPTIAADDYPIRKIVRSLRGMEGIKTVIYAGLGHTKAIEFLADAIIKLDHMNRKIQSDRLISTPWSAGGSITWSDVGGATAAVNGLIAATYTNVEVDAAITAATAGYIYKEPLIWWYNGPAIGNDGITITNGGQLRYGCHVPAGADTTKDVKIYIYLHSDVGDAAVTAERYMSSTADDEQFNYTNIDNNVADNLALPTANDIYIHTITVTAAGVADDDLIVGILKISEARVLWVHDIMFRFEV